MFLVVISCLVLSMHISSCSFVLWGVARKKGFGPGGLQDWGPFPSFWDGPERFIEPETPSHTLPRPKALN